MCSRQRYGTLVRVPRLPYRKRKVILLLKERFEAKVNVKVEFFAAAASAAGCSERDIQVDGRVVLSTVLNTLRQENSELARVLEHSTFLVDGVRAQRDSLVGPQSELHVLPPFAGG